MKQRHKCTRVIDDISKDQTKGRRTHDYVCNVEMETGIQLKRNRKQKLQQTNLCNTRKQTQTIL